MIRSLLLGASKVRGTRRILVVGNFSSERYVALEQKSRQSLHLELQSSDASTQQIPQLLKEWHELLPELSTNTNNPEEISAAVDRMTDLLWQCPRGSTSEPFALVLQAHRSILPNGPQALAVLQAWNDQWIGDLEQAPTLEDYHAVLEAYAASVNNIVSTGADESAVQLEGAYVALEILQQLDQWGYMMRPTAETYAMAAVCIANGVLHTDGDTTQLQSDLRNVAMQGMFQELHRSTAPTEIAPWVLRALSAAIKCTTDEDDGRDWVDLWTTLVPSSDAQKLGGIIDEAAIAILKLALRSNENEATLSLVDDTLGALESCDTEYFPRTEHYYLALKSWRRIDFTKRHRRDLLNRWLDNMKLYHEKTLPVTGKNLTMSWNHLMMGYFEAAAYDQVLSAWNQMCRSRDVKRDSISYGVVLKALAQKGTFADAERAHAIWRKMVTIDPAKRHVHPTSQHYGSVMAAWSRTRDPRAFSFCRAVMDRLIEDGKKNPSLMPTVVHYTTLIASQGWSGDAATREGVWSTIESMKAAGVEMDRQSYVASMSALARMHSEKGAKYVECLLDEMELSGEQDLRPNRACYQAAILAWASSGSPLAVDHCEVVFKRLEDAYEKSGYDPSLKPNSACFVALIKAYANLGSTDCGRKAENVLHRQRMAARQKLAEEPDRTVFTAVMSTYSKDVENPDAPLLAEAVFHQMAQAQKDGNSAAAPDWRSITVLIQAFAQSDRHDKATRTRAILENMYRSFEDGDLAMKPTRQAFSAVLNACAFTHADTRVAKDEVVRIALATMNDMEEYVGTPNELSFRYIFNVIGRNIDDPNERLQLATSWFQRCCRDGFVSRKVIQTIQTYIPSLYQQLPLDSRKQAILPAKWTRRVKKDWNAQ